MSANTTPKMMATKMTPHSRVVPSDRQELNRWASAKPRMADTMPQMSNPRYTRTATTYGVVSACPPATSMAMAISGTMPTIEGMRAHASPW